MAVNPVFLCAVLAGILLASGSNGWAQVGTGKPSGGKAPVEIEASKQLEWLRDKNVYRASGDVVITQGGTVIKGDVAEAEYDPAIGPSALTVFTVTGHVVMVNDGRTIRADHGVYDTRTQVLTLTGQNLVLTAPALKVTAQESMTYDAAEGKAVAKGKAHITETGRELKADRITAWLSKETNTLQRATADGNVLITHQGKEGTDIAQARRAQYDVTGNIITLEGNVRLTRGENHMQGDRATVNLTTGVSSLQNTGQGGGRVRAIFTSGDSATPLPRVTGSVPVIKSKDAYEQPYAIGR